MQQFEFKVIPAPRRGIKMRGVKTSEDRFAVALAQVMNEQGREGWDYVRADALPCDERVGLTGSKTTYLNMLVFRRPLRAEGGTLMPDAGPVPAALRSLPPEDTPAMRIGVTSDAPSGAAPPVGPARVAAE